ncbi:asparagine synthase (glutamine-hydrolyzing) [Desulfococcaceae bacterium HSG7]|nr:asparagine synthase (glutamine-hydrolyzing) [Desulfococcaceae bacterium HSG7]
MCGIVGVYNLSSKEPVSQIRLHKALKVIQHRGPDANKVSLINKDTGLGHVRLSIIDLSQRSNQPFEYHNLTISYNGEIYNYIEIKKELVKKGYSFKTESDTEVVIIAYLHWGEECVAHFNGMWAFAIYDKSKDVLFCSRDRFGIKPFNYTFTNGRFIFASEIKAILAYDNTLKKPNYNSIAQYLRETVGAQAEETWFDKIYRLKPAHNLLVTRTGHTEKRYWNYPEQSANDISYEQAGGKYQELLKDSVNLRMRSDVTVGLTLSGGLDSSSIACLLKELFDKNLNAYTASFPNSPFDEYPIAKKLCDRLQMRHIGVSPQYDVYVDTISQIVYHLESGHGSPAIYPLWWIAKRAKEDIVVYLEGQGADEALGGYVNAIIIDYILHLCRKGRMRQALTEMLYYKKNRSFLLSIMLFCRQEFSSEFRKIYQAVLGIEGIYEDRLKIDSPFKLDWNEPPESYSKLNKRLFYQHQSGLVNLLHYGDAISMAHSLENRLPFMDYRLVEFVFKLPDRFKLKNGLGKYIHREAVKDFVPEYICNNYKKLGFVSPLRHIFSEPGFGTEDIILGDKINQRGLFKRQKVKKLFKLHKYGKVNYERLFFKILSTELWFRHFIDN